MTVRHLHSPWLPLGLAPLVLAALALAFLPLSACTPRPTFGPPEPRPIIILDIDTLRADHLGCYGYERATSPAIDRLAGESIRFEWAFSQAPNTPPSQTSILTALYPSTHGMVLDEDRVPDSAVTLAEALAAQGYRTAAFVDGGYMSPNFGIDQGFDLYRNHAGKGLEAIGPDAIEWVRKHASENFLLLVHTYDTHTPYDPPEPYQSMFLEGLAPSSPGFEPSVELMEKIRLSVWTEHPKTLPPNDMEWAKARYDGGIRYVDNWIGEFVEVLRELGLLERAIIVLLSDHGEEFGEHGSVLHEKLYATVTHIPLLLRLPGGSEVRTVPDIVESIDVMPTLLDLVGVEVPAAAQGRSLLPLLRGENRGPHLAFGESPYFGIRRFIALGDYRLLLTKKTGAVELYRFREDPHEQIDLAAQEPEVARRLERGLLGWQAMIDRTQLEANEATTALDPATLEQLRALGYIR